MYKYSTYNKNIDEDDDLIIVKFKNYIKEKEEEMKAKNIYKILDKLNIYNQCENEMESLLKTLPNNIIDKYKKSLNELLYQSYTKYDFIVFIEKNINLNIFNDIDFSAELKNLFKNIKEQDIIKQELDNIINKEYKTRKNKLIKDLNISGLNNIPDFILANLKKLIKQKLYSKWRFNYDNPQKKTFFENNKDEYNFMYDRYSDFYDNRMNFFDLKYLNNNKDIPALLYKALYYSNEKYLSTPYNFKSFVANTNNYLNLLGVENDIHIQNEIFLSCKNKTDTIDSVFKQLIYHIDGNQNAFLFIILNISAMLNHINELHDDGNGNKIPVFSPCLKCNTKDKEMLYNFLTNFQKYYALNKKISSIVQNNYFIKINYIVENYIFSSIVKSYERILFDENHKIKIPLNYLLILDLLDSLDANNKEILEMYDACQYENLDEFKKLKLFELYQSFKKNYMKIECNEYLRKEEESVLTKFLNKSSKKISNIKNLFAKKKSILKIIIKSSNIPLLNPIDPISSSMHICICINGFYFTKEFIEYNNHKNYLYNIINDEENKSVCYYIYDWQNTSNLYIKERKSGISQFFSKIQKSTINKLENTFTKRSSVNNINNIISSKEIEYNKKYSNVYGKLLAYILASKQVFKFHVITLLGIGLGCNVIKHCLKHLETINNSINVSDIIQNVIMIGGGTRIYKKHIKSLQLINSHFYNIYNERDHTFLDHFNNFDIIGNKPFTLYDNDQNISLPIIKNFNITPLNCTHTADYSILINHIINLTNFH